MSELAISLAESGPGPIPGSGADGRLIEAARTDPHAFGRLYRRHYAAITGYLLRRTGDEHLAEDLAAETFIAAWRAMGRYRRTGVPFRAWLMRIATNQANAAARHERSRRRTECSAPPPDAGGTGTEARELVHAAVRALRPDHQAVIALVHFESMSLNRASLVLGVPEGTVKSRLARARDALRVELQRLGALP